MRESVVERYLVKRVKEYGGVAEKHVSPGRRGVPDRDVMWPYKAIYGVAFGQAELHWVETKAPNGALSDAQKRDHARRRKMGFKVFVLWSKPLVDWYIRECLRSGKCDRTPSLHR